LKLTAKHLLELLAVRHSRDVFVPECKTGPTQTGSGHLRMDGWAMKSSWTKPHTYCYEIKVSRQDFVNDNKWQLYLPYASNFYFVTPPGLVQLEEIPEQAGWLVCSKNGTRLYTKKKAPWRDVDIPEDLFRYVLMCRAQITREHTEEEHNLDYWKNWLNRKQEGRDIGQRVSRELTEKYSKDVLRVETENVRLSREITKFQELSKFLKANGLSVHHWNVADDAAEILRGDRKLPKNVVRAIEKLLIAVEQLEELTTPRPAGG